MAIKNIKLDVAKNGKGCLVIKVGGARKKAAWIWLIIAIFFCKELLWAYLIPPWKAPDELAHLGYVQYLAEKGDFPVLGKTTFTEIDFEAGGNYRAEDAGGAGSGGDPRTAAGIGTVGHTRTAGGSGAVGAAGGNTAVAAYHDGLYEPQSADKSVRAHTITNENNDIATGSDVMASLPHAPYINWIAQHPPLYYVMLLPVYKAFEGLWTGAGGGAVGASGGAQAAAVSYVGSAAADSLWLIFVLRILSIILGCVTLYFSYRALRILSDARAEKVPHSSIIPAGDSFLKEILIFTVTAGMAFLPGFSHISALVNNDNLVNALAAFLFFLVVKDFIIEKKFTGGIAIGIVLGLLALTKITALPLWGAVLLIAFIKFFKISPAVAPAAGPAATVTIAGPASAIHEKQKLMKSFANHLLKIFGIALLVSGWWYVRNIILYGLVLPDLAGIVAKNQSLLLAWPDLSLRFPEIINYGASTNPNLAKFIFSQNFFFEYFKNFWGVFGIPMRNLFDWQYWILGGICLAAGAGYVRKMWAVIIKSMENGKNNASGKNTAKNLIRPSDRLQRILSWPDLLFWIPMLAVFGALFFKLFQIYLGRGFLGAMHGRYVYSVLMPIIYLLLTGIVYLFGTGGRGRKRQGESHRQWLLYALAGLIIFFVLNDFYTLTAIIIP